MALNSEIYEKAEEIIKKRKLDAEMKAEAKMRLFETLEPAYKEYKDEMINSVQDAIHSITMNPEEVAKFVQEQKIRNLTAQQNVKLLLRKHDLPDDYFEVKYFCPLCGDTGIVENRLCECHIELIKQMSFNEAGKKSPLKFCRFSDFKLDYYDDKYSAEYDCSPRQRMSDILDFCKAYSDSFDVNSPSVLMFGETGLGKTHLSLSIAGEVINKGYKVIYNSAQNIFNELQKERFGKSDTNGEYEAMVLESDLLVIDDLGAEFSTQFTNAALYNIVNTRINSALPTIISTNLDFKGLEERYTRRLSSRFIGEYAALNFIGADIRQLKNE